MRLWVEEQNARDFATSVLVTAEIARGIRKLKGRDPVQAAMLETWLRNTTAALAGRILAVDENVAARWAEFGSIGNVHVIDSLIAATAMAHGLTVVTRNVKDFSRLGIPVLDPFAAPDKR